MRQGEGTRLRDRGRSPDQPLTASQPSGAAWRLDGAPPKGPIQPFWTLRFPKFKLIFPYLVPIHYVFRTGQSPSSSFYFLLLSDWAENKRHFARPILHGLPPEFYRGNTQSAQRLAWEGQPPAGWAHGVEVSSVAGLWGVGSPRWPQGTSRGSEGFLCGSGQQ